MGNPDLDSYFDAVYAETFNSVSKFVVSHAARFQDSEDIIQNVYTRFYKRISEKGFADIESAEAFLINIAKFECRSVFSGFMRIKEREVILSEIDEEQSARNAAFSPRKSAGDRPPPLRLRCPGIRSFSRTSWPTRSLRSRFSTI